LLAGNVSLIGVSRGKAKRFLSGEDRKLFVKTMLKLRKSSDCAY